MNVLKKVFTPLLFFLFLVSCDKTSADKADKESEETKSAPIRLTVTTTYGGDDGGRQPYEKAIKQWEEKTGNIVLDVSAPASEDFRKKVLTDFKAGAEADILFFFNGVAANPFIKQNKVVSISEITSSYPDYANEHDLTKIPPSPYDNVAYAVPTYGYWELMFANRKVLETANVSVPDENTDWNDFLAMCEKIKKAGYTPIAASLHEIPHYWFEYTVLNHGGLSDHRFTPKNGKEYISENLEKGLQDIRDFYVRGFFPDVTLASSHADSWQMIYDDKAAFIIDGSWKVGAIEKDAPNPDLITACFVPGKGKRKTTDIIAGLSSGWYITRKAWEDKEKQKTAVDFVNYITSREVVATFDSAESSLSLIDGLLPNNSSALRMEVFNILDKATARIPAIQDSFTVEQRKILFGNIKNVLKNKKSEKDVIKEVTQMKS